MAGSLWSGAQGKARSAIRSMFIGRLTKEWHGLKCFGIWLANRENLAHKRGEAGRATGPASNIAAKLSGLATMQDAQIPSIRDIFKTLNAPNGCRLQGACG